MNRIFKGSEIMALSEKEKFEALRLGLKLDMLAEVSDRKAREVIKKVRRKRNLEKFESLISALGCNTGDFLANIKDLRKEEIPSWEITSINYTNLRIYVKDDSGKITTINLLNIKNYCGHPFDTQLKEEKDRKIKEKRKQSRIDRLKKQEKKKLLKKKKIKEDKTIKQRYCVVCGLLIEKPIISTITNKGKRCTTHYSKCRDCKNKKPGREQKHCWYCGQIFVFSSKKYPTHWHWGNCLGCENCRGDNLEAVIPILQHYLSK